MRWDSELENVPGLRAVLLRAIEDPDAGYRDYLAMSPEAASHEADHSVLTNRFAAGQCHECLAPIFWLGPLPTRTTGGRWVHGPFTQSPPASTAGVGPSASAQPEQARLDIAEAAELPCRRERIEELITALAGVSVSLPPEGESCAGPLHGHHWLPRADGGPNTRDNLVSLCRKHHEMVHRLMGIYGRAELDPPPRRSSVT